jgi:aminomethyltransferase
MPTGTPFHSRTSALCETQYWGQWAGYFVAASYQHAQECEYFAIRNTAGLIDVTPLFKYRIRGRDAERFVNRLITRDITKCKVGQVFYTPWCDGDGKVIDDGTVLRLGEDDFRIVTGDPTWWWLHENVVGMNVKIEDESDNVAAAALQGPLSRDILKQVCDADLDSLKYFHVTRTAIGGVNVELSRTGYTGDLGYEVWVSAEGAERVWDALMAAGKNYGIVPAGQDAMLIARVEAGLVIIDLDFIGALKAMIASQKHSPFELSLDWTVNLKKEMFVGRRALVEEKRKGSPRKLVGFQVDWGEYESYYDAVGLSAEVPDTAWDESTPIYTHDEETQIGKATSGTWSPMASQYVAFGAIETAYARLGTKLKMELTFEHEPRMVTVKVVKLPFYDPPHKKA